MKRMIIALVAMFMMTFTTASAMSYEQARQQALFLTDKMAYELNLTDDQYEAAYEVNLAHSAMPLISIALSTGTQATGISASTHATLAATISSSVALTSSLLTMEAIAGE